jgi:hypothetical protein
VIDDAHSLELPSPERLDPDRLVPVNDQTPHRAADSRRRTADRDEAISGDPGRAERRSDPSNRTLGAPCVVVSRTPRDLAFRPTGDGSRPPNRATITTYPAPKPNGMALLDSLVVFVVSLLVGALGIYIGARVITDQEDYTYAIVTALIGAIIWAVVGFLFGWIPLLGPLLTLIAYVAVINYRYPGGWGNAVLISLIAWVASLVVLYVLALVGIGAFEAVGVPGA